jgi:hypothetical protein
VPAVPFSAHVEAVHCTHLGRLLQGQGTQAHISGEVTGA